ncbi:MAG TPA: hypothetical protein VE953_20415 [Terriglobales bacterium]|nr:hypothetical protein [Terriglobales bacterium]
MRLKVLFAVVMGLLAAALVPVSSQLRGAAPTGSTQTITIAQLAASAARMQATPAPAQAGPALNCSLIVPEDPLTREGLATPWELTADGAGPCRESDTNQSAFVEAAVLDPATGQVSAYDPLVIDRGSRPAIEPTRPDLPAGAVVGIWVGFNGNIVTLRGPGAQSCVTGADGSIFGQQSFCNAVAFFDAANAAIKAGKLAVPALGTARDGRPCPTSRDFSVVDQDQSDNTTTTYLLTAKGRVAQNTPANAAALSGAGVIRHRGGGKHTPANAPKPVPATVLKNGSDEGLVDRAIDTALGCTPWTVPNLADPQRQLRSTSWPLNELMAAARQAPPIALVPAGDPFVAGASGPSLSKLNAYRAGVDQPAVTSLTQASTTTYCQNLLRTGLPRIASDQQFTGPAASPFPDVADSLFTFLATRFNATFSNGDGFLHCEQLLNVQNPVTLQTDAAGVVTGAVINLHPGPAKP